jgi:hypothetical protein
MAWRELSSAQKWLIVVAVIAFVVLPLFAGLWANPGLIIALPYVAVFGAIVLFSSAAWLLRKFHL